MHANMEMKKRGCYIGPVTSTCGICSVIITGNYSEKPTDMIMTA